jgi:hypothetical protein
MFAGVQFSCRGFSVRLRAPLNVAPVFLCVCALFWASRSHAQQVNDPADVTSHDNSDSLPDAPKPNRIPKQAVRLTFGERFDLYSHSILNPDSLVGPAMGAAINQARDEPPEWGQGADAFGKRFASGYGQLLINRTIRFGVAALDHEDPRFRRSDEAGFWRRFKSAALQTVVVRTDSGRQIPAFSRFAGAYGAAFIANEWYPPDRSTPGHALKMGSIALSTTTGWNVFREFWPDIKQHLHKRR